MYIETSPPRDRSPPVREASPACVRGV